MIKHWAEVHSGVGNDYSSSVTILLTLLEQDIHVGPTIELLKI